MDWGEIFLTVITNLTFTAVLLAALGFLGRALIERWLSRNLEKYKAELQATNTRELEKFRADLKLLTFEHETRYAKLHEKRVEVIAELYKLLVQFSQKLNGMANSLRIKKHRGLPLTLEPKVTSGVAESFSKSWDYFNEHRLYFTNDLCKKVEKQLLSIVRTSIMMLYIAEEIQPNVESWPIEVEQLVKSLKNTDVDLLDRALSSLSDLQKATQEIEKEFRTMLGGTNETNSGDL